MSASCATASAKVDQSQLTKTGANSYVGRFFNEQYNTGGSIRVTVSGRSGSVSLFQRSRYSDLFQFAEAVGRSQGRALTNDMLLKRPVTGRFLLGHQRCAVSP